MTVRLASLKVNLDGDASGYVRMAGDMERATARMIASDARRVRSHSENVALMERAHERATRTQRFIDDTNDKVQRIVAANDNAKSSYLQMGAEAVTLAGHLKFLAVAAYAVSPAFRSIVNPAVVSGLAALGPAAASAGSAIFTALSPALAFASKIAVPILALAAAWQTLNHTVNHGAGLLDKYGNAQRNLIGGVDDNLKTLTRFQDNGLSADQVQLATQLGERLNEAKRTISEFSKVQLDLTSPALALQGAWVSIVETIAKAVEWANKLPQSRPMAAINDWLQRNYIQGQEAPDWILPPEDAQRAVSQADALRAAYERLRGGMGSTSNFAVRFGNAINDLQNPIKETTKTTREAANETRSAYDRAVDAVNRHIAVMHASAQSVGEGAFEMERLKTEALLTEAAFRTGGLDAVQKYAAKIFELARNAGAAAEAVTKARQESRVQFDADTLFMSPRERRVAQEMQNIYGPAWKQNMNSAIADQMRFNDLIRDVWETSKGFTSDFVSGLMSGKSVMGALEQAATNLSRRLAEGAIADLFSGNFISAGIKGIAAIGAHIFGQGQQKQKEQQQMMAEALRIQQQSALIGLDTNTRSGALQTLKVQQAGELNQAAMQKNWYAVIAMQDLHRKQLMQLNKEWDQREIEAERQKQEAIAARVRSFEDIIFSATHDDTTLEGKLVALERDRQQAIIDERKAGGEAMLMLEAAFEARKYQLIKESLEEIIAEENRAAQQRKAAADRAARSITEWLIGLDVGPNSQAAPPQQLATAQAAYDATLLLAQQGNPEALDRLTGAAETLRQALIANYGSTTPMQEAMETIRQQLLELPAVQESSDPVVQALNNIASRQENVFFEQMTTAASAANDLAARQVDLQQQMVSALNRMSQYQAQAAQQAADAAAAQAAQQAAQQAAALDKLKADNRARFNTHMKMWTDAATYGTQAEKNYVVQLFGPNGPNPANYQPMRLGGIVGALAGGGMVGNGIWDVDSVLARYAGGGNIALAGGEGVLTAPATRNIGGRSTIDYINRYHMLPAANDNVAPLLARISKLEERLGSALDLNARLLSALGEQLGMDLTAIRSALVEATAEAKMQARAA